MRRDPAKAIAILDAMLEYFEGGRRWTRGMLRDQHQHRCLIGALRHVRRQQHIRGAGTEHYLRAAFWTFDPLREDLADPLIASIIVRWRALEPDDRDLMNYNDDADSYDDVRALIIEARALAQAELEQAQNPPPHASTSCGFAAQVESKTKASKDETWGGANSRGYCPIPAST
jgi:hypothetical protein